NEERAKELKKRFTIKKRDDNTYEVMDGQWSYDGRIFATLKQAEERRQYAIEREASYGRPDVATHPLLRSYETLAVKTAIQQALKGGATKLVLPDPETAMIIEGHDRNLVSGAEAIGPRK